MEALKVVNALHKGSGQNPPGFHDDRLHEALEVLATTDIAAVRRAARHLWRDGSPGEEFVLELVKSAGAAERFPTAATVAGRKLRIVRLMADDWSLSPELRSQIDAALA